jgi:hypothetical protein
MFFRNVGPGVYETFKFKTPAGEADMVIYEKSGQAWAAKMAFSGTPRFMGVDITKWAEPLRDAEGNLVPAPADWKNYSPLNFGGDPTS